MANYPTLPQAHGSVKESNYNTNVEVAVSGAVRLRSLFSRDWAVFRIVHDCDSDGRDLIFDHYEQHKNVSFSVYFYADAQAYTVRYNGAPQERVVAQNVEWELTVLLVQV
jgi:hypothetical protein